jgi:formylglycine-generating enzyme required for sulfatase activity
MFGSNGQAWKYDEHFNSPSLNQEPGFLAETGAYSGCSNDEGIYDMVGNLHEWVSDSVDEAFIDKLQSDGVERRKQPSREGNGVFLGGFYSTTSEHGPGCKFTTIAHEPTYHDYSTGFRCCLTIRKPTRSVVR